HVMGRQDLAGDPRFATQAARHSAREALDGIVAEWCAARNAEEAAEALQRAGVAAHVSWSAADIVGDVHLRARGAIVDVVEGDGRRRAAVGAPARFSKSDNPAIERGTPGLGEHEDYVYGELLGIGRREYGALVAEQVIY
ncbi:MAG: CoA transferase, partial [Aquamicrobium sp.]|nr:CoA transferase [Aquamicrobium sp.]